MSGDDISFKTTVQVEDYSDVAYPHAPGNHPVPPREALNGDPNQSPHLKEGEKPVWIACRASSGCEGKYGVQVTGGEIGLDSGGGSWLRYRCLTCGKPFHIVR